MALGKDAVTAPSTLIRPSLDNLLFPWWRTSLFGRISATVSNPALGQIVWGQLYFDSIARQYLDVISANFARDVRQYIKTVIQIDAEHCIGKGLGYRAFHFD